jgi:phosphocarrier protein HPr
MPSTVVTVGSTSGLHARPASQFAQAALVTGATVTIAKAGGKPVNASSILSLLALGAESGEEVTLTVEGDDAEAKLSDLAAMLGSNLDEAQRSPV